ncbi:MAG TPA: hypothetical protein VFQ65_20390 [Kofleriaceae bacterium]|nr:hypothetical protein [Kofleriaceae bacterium]
MRRLLFVIGLAACKDTELTKLEQVKQQVCACKDVACAETAMKNVPSGDVHPNHREQGIARDMLDCLAKLYDAAKPQLPE